MHKTGPCELNETFMQFTGIVLCCQCSECIMILQLAVTTIKFVVHLDSREAFNPPKSGTQ